MRDFEQHSGAGTIRAFARHGLSVRAEKLFTACIALMAAAMMQQNPTSALAGEPPPPPKIFVPFDDLDAVLAQGRADPWGYVLMPADVVDDLLRRAAEFDERRGAAPLPAQAAITAARYAMTIDGERVRIRGTLEVRSERDGWIGVTLWRAAPPPAKDAAPPSRIAVRQARLDDGLAPLGRDAGGALVLFVEKPGVHTFTFEAALTPEQTPSGLRLAMHVPAAPIAEMTVDAVGDVTFSTNVPQSEVKYDAAADRTRAILALGAADRLDLSVEGNGRRTAEKATLLSETISRVGLSLGRADWNAQITADILRRTVRSLELSVSPGWNIARITHPDLQAWRIEEGPADAARIVHLSFRRPLLGKQTIRLEAEQTFEPSREWSHPVVVVRDAADAIGVWRVAWQPGLLLRGVSAERARLIDDGGQVGARAFFVWGERPGVLLSIEREAARLNAVRWLRWTIGEDGLSLLARLRLEVQQGESFGTAIELADGVELHNVVLNRPREDYRHEIETVDGRRRVRIEWRAKLAAGGSLDIELTGRMSPRGWRERPEGEIELPLPSVTGVERESGGVVVAAEDDLAIKPARVDGLKAIAPDVLGNTLGLGRTARRDEALGYSFRGAGDEERRLSVQVTRLSPIVTATAVNLAAVETASIGLETQVDFDIQAARVRDLYLRLPADAGAATQFSAFDAGGLGLPIMERRRIEAPPADAVPGDETELDRNLAGGALWRVRLDAPTTGRVSIVVRLETPRAPDGPTACPLVWPAQVESFRAHLAVQGRDEHELTFADVTGLRESQAFDLPPTRLNPTQRLVGVFEFAGPAGLTIAATAHAVTGLPPAVIDTAAYQSVIDADGTCRTRAELLVKNAGLQFLRVGLAPGAKLWSLVVDGEPAKPREGAGGDLRIALPISTEGVRVELIYEQALPPLGRSGWVRQAPPRYADTGGATIPTNRTTWEIFPPPDYVRVDSNGDLSPLSVGAEPLAYEKLLRAAYALLNSSRVDPLSAVSLGSLSRARELSTTTVCASNLRGIGQALYVYAQDGGVFPESEADWVDRLLAANSVTPKALLCPAAGDTAGCSYRYVPGAGPNSPPYQIVAYEKPSNHGGEGGHVLYADGRVEFLSADDLLAVVRREHGEAVAAELWRRAREINSLVNGSNAPAGEPAAADKDRAEYDLAARVDLGRGAGGGRPGDAGKAQAPPPPAEKKAAEIQSKLARGRRSLPVDLQGRGDITFAFAGLGQHPTVELQLVQQCWRRGITGAIVAGLLLATFMLTRATRQVRTRFVLGLLVIASVLPLLIGRVSVAHCNAAFNTGLVAAGWFILTGLLARLGRRLGQPRTPRSATSFPPSAPPGGAVTATLIALCITLALSPVALADPPAAEASKPPAPPFPDDVLIVPYNPAAPGWPATGIPADRVLVPYARFVELWNKAHPERRILLAEFLPTRAAFAQADYEATIDAPQAAPGLADGGIGAVATLTIRGELSLVSLADGWTAIPLPIRNATVRSATVVRGAPGRAAADGAEQPAVLRPAGDGFELFVDRAGAAVLRLEMVVTAALTGTRGEVLFDLPPAHAGRFVVKTTADRLVDIVDAPGGQDRSEADGTATITAAMAESGRIHLRWQPKPEAGFRDDAMTAEVNTTYALMESHMRLAGEARWSLPLSRTDRFSLSFEAGCEVLRIVGADVHDWEAVRREDGGVQVDIRLHRAVEKAWSVKFEAIAPLPIATATGVPQIVEEGREPRMSEPFGLPAVHAPGVRQESGHVVIAGTPAWTLRVAEAAGMTQIDLPADAAAVRSDTGAWAAAAYHYAALPYTLRITAAEAPQQLIAANDLLARLADDRTELFYRASVEPRRGKPHALRFSLPAEFDLLAVSGPLVRDYWFDTVAAADEGRRVLRVALKAGLVGATPVVIAGSMPLNIAAPVGIEPIWLLDAYRQRGRTAVQALPPLEASVERRDGLLPLTPRALSGWLTPAEASLVNHAFRWDAQPAALVLAVHRNQPRVQAEVVVGLHAAHDLVKHVARLRYEVSRAGQDRFSFELPDWPAARVRINAANVRTIEDAALPDRPGRRRWTVTLQAPVLGAVEIVAAFDQPIEAGASVEAAQVVPIEAESTRWTLLLQAAENVDANVTQSDGLERLAAAALDLPLPPEATRNLTAAYRGYQSRHGLALSVTPRTEVRLDRAAVTGLELETSLALSGDFRARATMHVENRTEQYLQVRLPEGAELWSVTVAGRGVRPATEPKSGDVLIPLVKTSAVDTSFAVVVDFLAPGRPLPGSVGRVEFPTLDVVNMPVHRTAWKLFVPDEYTAHWHAGNLSPVEELELKLEQVERATAEAQRLYETALKERGDRQQRAFDNFQSLVDANRGLLAEIEQHSQRDEVRRNKAAVQKIQTKFDAQSVWNDELAQKAEAFKGTDRGRQVGQFRTAADTLELMDCAAGETVLSITAASALPDFWASPQAVTLGVPMQMPELADGPAQTAAQVRVAQQMQEMNQTLSYSYQPQQEQTLDALVLQVPGDAAGSEEMRKQYEETKGLTPPDSSAIGAATLYEGDLKELSEGLLAQARSASPQQAQAPTQQRAVAGVPAILPTARVSGLLSLAIDMPTSGRTYSFSKTQGSPRLSLMLVRTSSRDSGARSGGLLLMILAAGLIIRALRRPRFVESLRKAAPLALVVLGIAAVATGYVLVGVAAITAAVVCLIYQRIRRAADVAA
ncbi:MAG: hypothetical protein L6R00_08005 [Phycisphaerae bacterium]|nr:hypothetical protein [Phycisphaerae bacterium]